MNKLVGRPRLRVLYRDPDNGKLKSLVVSASGEPRQANMLGHPVLVFESQDNGDPHVMDAALVERVVREQQDSHYGKWHKIGEWKLPAQ